MQIKGSKYTIFGTHQIPLNLHFASPLAKQNEKSNQRKKHKSSFVGETIAFSVCNKPFKPLGLPRGRVKSREGLPEMIPTNILEHYVVVKTKTSIQTHGSYIMSKLNKVNITITSDITNQLTHS
jgi:hypothetical protein